MGEELFVSRELTPVGGFTEGIEGPACDRDGNLYAVNYDHQGTIGRVTPEGEASVFLELPEGSVGNGIRFNLEGEMFVADYTGHNVLRVDMGTRAVAVHCHEPRMNQPNDIAIASNGTIFASDPSWSDSTGQIWRVDVDGTVELLESGMGTTNGIEVGPEDRVLYVNESVQRRIWAYDLGPDGEMSNKRLLIEFEDYGLDGMRCDVAGNLYVTRWGKGEVVKLSPGGELLARVALAGKNCTNLTFGGPDGRTCYVTVADRGNIEVFRADLPGRDWWLWQMAAERELKAE